MMLEARSDGRWAIVRAYCPVTKRLKLVEQQLHVRRYIIRDENERARLLRRIGHSLWSDAQPEAEDVGALLCVHVSVDLATRALESDIEVRTIAEELGANTARERQLLHFLSCCKKWKCAISRAQSQYCLPPNHAGTKGLDAKTALPRVHRGSIR